jgi:hypothetical protein
MRKGERSFLADQAADAKTAMIQTLLHLKETLSKVADVRRITKQHPWLVLGSAVAAGFATGAVLTPSPRNKLKGARSNTEAASEPRCQGQETPRTKKSLLFTTMARALGGLLQTVLQSSITAAIVTKDQLPTATTLPNDSTETGASEIDTD